MILAQFTRSNDSLLWCFTIFVYLLLVWSLLLLSASFLHFYWVQAVLCSNCKLKTFVYSYRYTTFSSEKQYTVMWQVLRLSPSPERARPYVEFSERKLQDFGFLELVPSQGRKPRNSNANDFPSSCSAFQSELFPKFVFYVEKLVTLLLFRQLTVHLRQNRLIILKISTDQGSSQNFMTIRLHLWK